ncbi:cbb3-type cytochrome oxidase assembly protein CcoS [Hydrocarboniclastica marina]|uniref:Cbb3-type cytochrome oxidase assembly protein CcoS n=1 Tax=Hydrocarboniclastica marina TaxID=2259620 RepID=A0A4V1D8L7_9ALTE|nr:cbb3-type cytochrome oxidase assembly protein CcoS [Hydrocarboniclastica marina]MAL98623.1 cbb3-type cytochrome oxidase assembly protein CcoS [Alteromonadaceae bacterium]QCF25630.1 cbb3-type cytochrome oxidase assembly protein CcoS [Hydrocarboniclastica marina]|tara:strand:- start:3236 stop:3493 length:258 start_codon:yes stop_codon:yes gene_type:complete
MEILYLLIPISLGLLGIAIAVFFWAVRSGQMDDLERPGHSILYDDDEDMIPDDAKQEEIGSEAGRAPAQQPRPKNSAPPSGKPEQ